MDSKKMPRVALLTALLLASWAAPVRAGDGRLEINQACALVGCFAGDTAGFPVEIASAGSYVLTSNLAPTGGVSGITTVADGVVVDLNGFELRGPGSCSATIDGTSRPTAVACVGISSFGLLGPSVVRNGTIRGFSTAIGTPAGETLRVAEVVVTQNGNGIAAGSRGLILTDSVLSLHSVSGGSGTSVASRYTVRGCLFERNTQGLYLANGIATESSFHQNLEALRSNAGGQALVANASFTANVVSISGANVAYRSNVFDNNASGPTGTDLGSNICSGAPCP